MKYPLVLFLGATLILTHVTSAHANDSLEVLELQVSRIGDVELSCGDLSQEAMLMHDIIGVTQDIQDDSKIKSYGINAAVGAGGFLIGTVTGGIGFAAAGFLLDQSTKDDAQEADGVQDVAQQRRSLMTGIFNAKGCHGPIEHVMQDNVEVEETKLASVEPLAGEEILNAEEKAPSRKPHYND